MQIDPLQSGFLNAVRSVVGARAVVVEEADVAPHLSDWRGMFSGDALAVVRPKTAIEVSALVRLCAAEGVSIVPQGGNTGLVGGATPVDCGPAIVLQTTRLNAIRKLDAKSNTLIVEAGCVLADVHAAVAEVDRLFPLRLGSEGSAQIGGLIATNAGGVNVLRYGMMRDLVLGLEVVLPDGAILSDLPAPRKDNTGYDLKQLFIGSEGTLGVITAAKLSLHPKPKAYRTAFLALGSLEHAPHFLETARDIIGPNVEACELIPKQGVEFALRHVESVRHPLEADPEWMVLAEFAGSRDDRLSEDLDTLLEATFERGLVTDGVVAQNEAQAETIWRLREAIVEGQRLAGRQFKHDVAVEASDVPAFIDETTAAVLRDFPDALINPFGHLGDGNIHFNVTLPAEGDHGDVQAATSAIAAIVYERTGAFGGSISAEHGLGRLKAHTFEHTGGGDKLAMMRRLRGCIDPMGIFNPGVFMTRGEGE